MEKLTKLAKTIRNNWKKSVFGAVALYYGANKAKEKYQINILMRAACKEAAVYGDSLIPIDRNPTLVTVILNPVANKRSAKKDYEKYCEPLLNLAGLQVAVVQTTSDGHAREIVESLSGTEAIIVAGGDGTLSETITGLLRRNDDANQFPVGILPLGKTNSLANVLFPIEGNSVEKVRQLIKASMAIINGKTVWKDAMRIDPIPTDDEPPKRPIFALSTIQWGAFRDALSRCDNYWFVGPLRKHFSFLINGSKSSITWKCKGTVKYTAPCPGCTNCVVKKPEFKSKFSFFMSSSKKAAEPQVALITNPECSKLQELCFSTSEFNIFTPNVSKIKYGDVPALTLTMGKPSIGYTQFVSEGWRRLKGEKETPSNLLFGRTIELIPEETKDDVVIEIDKEEFDVKPMKITLIPKVIKLYAPFPINYT